MKHEIRPALALVAYLQTLAQRAVLDSALRAPPPVPDTYCRRGCNGCVWEAYFSALGTWRDEVCSLLPDTLFL